MSTANPLPPHEPNYQSIVGEIAAWTGRRGVKPVDVARALNMDHGGYSRRLRGSPEFRLSELLSIARFLDIDPGNFTTPSVIDWPNGRPDGPDGGGPGGRRAGLERAADKHKRWDDDEGNLARYGAAA